MADIAVDLLEAINTKLKTKTASGQTLEDIQQYFVKFTESDVPPEYGNQNPILMVDLLPATGEIITVCGRMTEKKYPLRFTIFTEESGDTTQKTAAELIDLIEDVFALQTLNVSEWVEAAQKNYTQPAAPPFEAPYNSGASMIITHVHTDVRTIPTQG
jgi:hypothetical protein